MLDKNISTTIVSILMLWIFAHFAHGIEINISEAVAVTDMVAAKPSVMINISETVGVSDSPGTQPSAWIDITEHVTVSDAVDASVLPIVQITLSETIAALDTVAPLPSVMINVSESVGVADFAGTQPSVWLDLAESVGVADSSAVTVYPVVEISIGETITTLDSAAMLPAAVINISETVGVSDSIGAQPSSWIDASEHVAVSDTAAVTVYPVVTITVDETVAVADAVAPLPSAWIDIAEPVTVSDTVDASVLPIVQITLSESIAALDTVAPLPSVMISVSESVGVADNVGTQPSVWIEVSEPVHVSDTVSLEALNIFAPAANAGGPYSGTEGQPITLDGSSSTDQDGSIVLFEWDIDDDGTYDYSSSSPTQSHTYTSQNNYTVRLRVTDSQGLTDEAITSAHIVDRVPLTDFSGSPTNGTPPLMVDFMNNSTGYDQPLIYEWDFDNNGTVDSTLMNPVYSYPSGIYSVKLIVTDSDGSTNSLLRTNYIRSCQPAVRIAGVTPIYFTSLQSAYDAAGDGQTIQSRDDVISENITFDRNITLTLIGGFNCDYTAATNRTTVIGNVNVSNGKVTIENFNVQK